MSLDNEEKINFVKLEGHSLKGRNRLKEAGTDIWEVVNDVDQVAFAPGEISRCLYVTPKGQSAFSKKARWVRVVNDKDFNVYFQW